MEAWRNRGLGAIAKRMGLPLVEKRQRRDATGNVFDLPFNPEDDSEYVPSDEGEACGGPSG